MACRTRRAKAELLRVVRRPGGTLVLDARGDLEGRGAYLCRDRACWELALKRSSLQRALNTPLPENLRTTLEHGDVDTAVATDHGAPEMMTGGTHGT